MKSAACILLCLTVAGCSSTGTAWYNNPDALMEIGQTLRAMGAAQSAGVGYIDTRPAFSENAQHNTYTPSGNWQTERMGTPSVTPNGYGLGVNSDTYGRPHVYRTQDGTALDPIFQSGVKRNAYGAGVHMDQFGRPVYDSAP